MEHIRVLIADDQKASRRQMRLLLEDWGEMEVVGEAENGLEAVREARKLSPDIVVMENLMPLMDGIAATKIISESHPGMGIVFLSTSPEVVRRAVLSGATSYVLRDFLVEDLPRAIHSAYSIAVFPADMERLEPQWRRIMEFMLREGFLTGDQAEMVFRLHRRGQSIPDILVERRFFTSQKLAEVRARALDVPFLRLEPITVVEERLDAQGERIRCEGEVDPVDMATARLVPEELARRLCVIPVCQSDGQILVAAAELLSKEAVAEIEGAAGFEMRLALSLRDDILGAIERSFAPGTKVPALAPPPVAVAPPHPWWQAWLPDPAVAVATAALCLVVAAMVNVLRVGFFLNYVVPFISLVIGLLFFIYAMKYYLTTAAILAFSSGRSPPNAGNKVNGYHTLGNSPGNNLSKPLKEYPFVSVHLATYNEEKVIGRLLTACTSFNYPNYEVVVVDDSTDGTVEALERWRAHPRVKVHHRESRSGFKGGALKKALELTDARSEYVAVFDADFVPPADSITRFLQYFERENNNGNGGQLGVVQGYQWHMLNADENWITRGVRCEFSGSYVFERAGQELYGGMKMISGSVYMIRTKVLRGLGWGTSITEDWEMTIKMYLAGYKVLYTPYIQAPAECVSEFGRLVKQRMRWAEGHTHNVKKKFLEVMKSANMTLSEKLEFLYYTPYYLQSAFFIVGTLLWLLSDFILGMHLPNWATLFGWSLVFANMFSLPLMNLSGIMLEGSVERDWRGLLSFVALCYILVPYQAYAAMKGLLEKEEGGWHHTPKTGLITETVDKTVIKRRFGWELPRGERDTPASFASESANLARGYRDFRGLSSLSIIVILLAVLLASICIVGAISVIV